MTDLDALVRAHLADQAAVDVPPVALVRRRAARRRRAVVGSGALAAAVVLAGAAVVLPSLAADERRDVVSGPTGDELVPPGAVAVAVCPAWPHRGPAWPYRGGGRLCTYGPYAPTSELATALSSAQGARTDLSGCRSPDADAPNVRIRLTYADGGTVDLRVVDCLLTSTHAPGAAAVHAPEVARAAGRSLGGEGLDPGDSSPLAGVSDREGCAAVVEDLADLLDEVPSDGGVGDRALQAAAQAVEVTMREERPYVTDAQRALVDDLAPRVNDLLLGHVRDGVRPADALRRGLARLRATC